MMVHKYENKEGFRKGASLPAGALLGEPGVGAPLLGIWRDMRKRAQGVGITLHGVPAGELGAEQQALETGISLHMCLIEMRGSVHSELLRDS
jgi:hypothetical protein